MDIDSSERGEHEECEWNDRNDRNDQKRIEERKRGRERESEREKAAEECTCRQSVGETTRNARKNRNRTDRNRVGTGEMAGIRGSTVRYGMVWYGPVMTVHRNAQGNSIGPIIPRRPFSVHIR